MVRKNLWGDLPPTDDIRTPKQILKEQAVALSDMTKSMLYGDVGVQNTRDQFLLTLRIVAPALENYTYDILSVLHPLEVYPLKVWPSWSSSANAKECVNAESFETALTEILQADRTRRVVAALLAQS